MPGQTIEGRRRRRGQMIKLSSFLLYECKKVLYSSMNYTSEQFAAFQYCQFLYWPDKKARRGRSPPFCSWFDQVSFPLLCPEADLGRLDRTAKSPSDPQA